MMVRGVVLKLRYGHMRRVTIILLIVATAFYFISTTSISTIIARYSRDLGISVERTSVLWSTTFLIALTLRLWAGYVADRVGFFKVLIIGLISLIVSLIIYSLPSVNYPLLLMGRAIQGVSRAFFISPSITATAVLAGNWAGVALGIRSAVVSLSNAITPPLAGMAADSMGYRAVFTVSLVMAFTSLFFLLLVRKGSTTPQAGIVSEGSVGWSKIITGEALLITTSNSMLGASFMSISGIVQMHYRDLGISARSYGLLFMSIALPSLLTRLISGKLVNRVAPEIISVSGFTLLLLGTTLFTKYYLIPYAYIPATIYGLGVGLIVPANQYKMITIAPKGGENRAVAMLNMGFDAGSFIGPVIFGYIASVRGYVESYRCLVIPPLIAILNYALMLTKLKKD